MKALSQNLLVACLAVFSMFAQAQGIPSKKISSGNKIKYRNKTVVSNINANNDSVSFIKLQGVTEKGYHLYGIVKGVDKGVIHAISPNNTLGDSAVIINGKFSISGYMKEPDRCGFIITPGNWTFPLLMEDTTITVTIDTADAQHQRGGGVDHPMIWHVEQTGSDFGDAYTRYFNETGQAEYVSLLKQLKFAAVADRKAIMNLLDSARGPMNAKQRIWIENYIEQNPASIAGIFIFSEFYHLVLSNNSQKEYLQSMLDRFTGKAAKSKYYKLLSREVDNLKNREANTVAPDFTLLQRNKTKCTLSSKRGKIVLIDFWASWCVPCRKAIPHWKELYTKYRDKGFDILSLSTDIEWKDWTRALDKEKMPWTQVIDNYSSDGMKTKVADLFPSRTIPFYVLLDKEGKVLIATGDEDAITNKINEVMR